MAPMLPAPSATMPRLADALTSCRASLAGAANPWGLPRVRSAVVVLADGLGVANLRARAGHARHLTAALGKRDVAWAGFPSTTAVGLASLCTGEMPGRHGLVGYRVSVPGEDRTVNQLSGWGGSVDPARWQRARTVFESAADDGIDTVCVGPGRYARSGLSRAILRGARYLSAGSVGERFVAAERVLASSDPVLIYLYVPELDMAAHAQGWESDTWLARLEELDAEVRAFESRLEPDCGVLLTADHGVIDVPERSHVLMDEKPGLLDGVRHVGGDPRCVYLYLDEALDDAAKHDLLERWRKSESGRSWVLSRSEAVDAGLFGDVDSDVMPRIGEIIVAARSRIAYYDGRSADQSSRSMIGQHGSLTDEEMRVPAARLGAYRR